MNAYKNVDEYIANFPEEVQGKLEQIRKAIKEEVPEVGEKISYGVPTATINGKYFIYFAGYKNHLSLYPVTETMVKALKEVLQYRTGKGTLQFPLNKSLPMQLIKKIIKFRAQEARQEQ